MRLTATDLHATFTVRAPFRMPFHTGGLLHGLFGRALRMVACPQGACREGSCARGAPSCDWQRLFSPPAREPAPHRLLVGMSEPPGPVLLRTPAPGEIRDVSPGGHLSFGLRLFGEPCPRDTALLEQALHAVADLPVGPDGGRVVLRAITRYSPRDVGAELSAGMGGGSPDSGPVKVWFETPVRMKRGGKVAEDVQFAGLFSQVWRRLTMLSALYGEYGDEDEAMFRRLQKLASGVQTVEKRLTMLRWEHLSVESGVRKPMCGLVGHVVFEGGSLAELVPVLRAGEVVHAGGATSFGLGRLACEGREAVR